MQCQEIGSASLEMSARSKNTKISEALFPCCSPQLWIPSLTGILHSVSQKTVPEKGQSLGIKGRNKTLRKPQSYGRSTLLLVRIVSMSGTSPPCARIYVRMHICICTSTHIHTYVHTAASVCILSQLSVVPLPFYTWGKDRGGKDMNRKRDRWGHNAIVLRSERSRMLYALLGFGEEMGFEVWTAF